MMIMMMMEPMALTVLIVAVVMDLLAAGTLPRQGDRRTARKDRSITEGDSYTRPWEINENICPPALCPPQASSLVRDGIAAAPPQPKVFPFFEGDIVLDKRLKMRMEAHDARRQRLMLFGQSRQKRAIVRPVTRLWPYGIIPFVIDKKLNSRARKFIRAAFRHYERKTCLKFRAKKKEDKDYLHYAYQPGCWSYVGRKGGEQFLAVGSGCDHFGTIVHETGHALGFWHEQSRMDRDKYVKIVTKNISPTRLKQFTRRVSAESTSRGFVYDYKSIMHYGDTFFTINGEPTIKVIGIGKKYKFKIGQRKRLSDIDIAQLRDMYHCNKKDAEKKACAPGWSRYKTSCYLFVSSVKKQFSGAHEYCKDKGGHLLHVNNKHEDNFIKSHLLKMRANVTVWRTGGKKEKGKFVWYARNGKSHKPMVYTAWAARHPGKFSAMALERVKGTYVWRGTWSGSKKQLPKYTDSFICESPIKKQCISSKDGKGQDYRGKLDYTARGSTCQNWKSRYPHSHRLITKDKKMDEVVNGLGDHNYCRNPYGRRKRPWCFVSLEKTKWQYCHLEVC